MIFNVYSIKDTLAGEYGPLFTAKNDAVAERMVCEMFNKKVFKDMELYCLGTFDTEKGLHDKFAKMVSIDVEKLPDYTLSDFMGKTPAVAPDVGTIADE